MPPTPWRRGLPPTPRAVAALPATGASIASTRNRLFGLLVGHRALCARSRLACVLGLSSCGGSPRSSVPSCPDPRFGQSTAGYHGSLTRDLCQSVIKTRQSEARRFVHGEPTTR